MRASRVITAATLCLALWLGSAAAPALAQGLTQPPSGANQKATVIQNIGLVEVRIDYNSPDVTSPTGADRRGKIWGQLVPYGMANLGFGTCGDECPWRAGANENTVFSVSYDVQIQGKTLSAGSYGLHMIPGESEWTVIFSKDSSSWGSYFYEASEDALRITARPEESEFHEWLTFEFTDRQPEQATVALQWENLSVPWTIEVPNTTELYLAQMRRDLRSAPGFQWQSWSTAAQYCLQNEVNLEEGLAWAQAAVNAPFVGQENFTTLAVLGQLQAANGMEADGRATLVKAIGHPTATPGAVHQLGRQLQAMGKNQPALFVYEQNAEQHAGAWPTEFGLARGHAGVGDTAKALEHARRALDQAPNDPSRQAVQGLIDQLTQSGN